MHSPRILEPHIYSSAISELIYYEWAFLEQLLKYHNTGGRICRIWWKSKHNYKAITQEHKSKLCGTVSKRQTYIFCWTLFLIFNLLYLCKFRIAITSLPNLIFSVFLDICFSWKTIKSNQFGVLIHFLGYLIFDKFFWNLRIIILIFLTKFYICLYLLPCCIMK